MKTKKQEEFDLMIFRKVLNAVREVDLSHGLANEIVERIDLDTKTHFRFIALVIWISILTGVMIYKSF